MAPHSSTFAQKIPWTEEPGRLQSMGSLESDMTERLHFHFSLSCIGEGNGNPPIILAWKIPMDRGAQWAIVHRVTKSQIQQPLSTTKHISFYICIVSCELAMPIHNQPASQDLPYTDQALIYALLTMSLQCFKYINFAERFLLRNPVMVVLRITHR